MYCIDIQDSKSENMGAANCFLKQNTEEENNIWMYQLFNDG